MLMISQSYILNFLYLCFLLFSSKYFFLIASSRSFLEIIYEVKHQQYLQVTLCAFFRLHRGFYVKGLVLEIAFSKGFASYDECSVR